jgi:predicted TIM-barrel fold metal-dependent hydrolase
MADQQYTKRLLSADSHVMEPRDLWEKRIDAKWRDKAPRIEMLDESGDYIVIDGMRPRPLAFEGPMADLKAQGMEIPVPKGYRYEQNRPGSWDPNERLKDQDLDGVSGEVIYPGVGLHIVRVPDAEYLYACCRAYNDWLAEYCSVHPARLKGAALLPNRGPIEWAVSEAERAAKMGLVTAMLPSFMDDRAYNLPEWDRLWAALQDMNIVASMHLCGREPYGIAHGPGAGGINVGVIKFGMYDTVMRLIWGGAPMRFPKLKWRYRLDRLCRPVHGPLVGRSSRLDGTEAAGNPELLLPSPVLRHFRGRPRRCAHARHDRRRKPDVGFRLPAYRRRVALLAQKGGRELRQHSRGRHQEDGAR